MQKPAMPNEPDQDDDDNGHEGNEQEHAGADGDLVAPALAVLAGEPGLSIRSSGHQVLEIR